MPTKRVILCGDLHTGHVAGLTEPEWQWKRSKTDKARDKIARFQAAHYAWYLKQIEALKPVHCLCVLGDAIDGTGDRSKATEQITTDRLKQAKSAAGLLSLWEAPNTLMVRGTPYHTGDGEQFEDCVAVALGCKIGNHEWLEVNGLVLDLKHKIGSSSIPHGRHTAPAKAGLWNMIWADAQMQPRADVIVRAHVHYWTRSEQIGRNNRPRNAVTLPALQLPSTRFGSQQCEGTVDVGFAVCDVEEDGTYSLRPVTMPLGSMMPEVIRC